MLFNGRGYWKPHHWELSNLSGKAGPFCKKPCLNLPTSFLEYYPHHFGQNVTRRDGLPLLTARRATHILFSLSSCQFTRAPVVKLRLVIVFQYGCVITNMPSHCCVPDCSSNYDSKSHASTFLFFSSQETQAFRLFKNVESRHNFTVCISVYKIVFKDYYELWKLLKAFLSKSWHTKVLSLIQAVKHLSV